MKSHENPQFESNLKQDVASEILRDPTLVPEHGILFGLATENDAEPLSALYKAAFDRGDFLTRRYESLQDQIFNPDWLVQDLQDPSRIRFIFTNSERQLLGATAFFHDSDSDAGALETSDGTEIDPSGRGLRIMDHFFKRIVPVIEASGAGLAADFMLTPESKSLRRTLQTDLGMIAIGIHPHALQHPTLGIRRSLIEGVKYQDFTPKSAHILPEFEPLYRIVQSQLLALPEPEIVQEKSPARSPQYIEELEVVRSVDAADPQAQLEAIEGGWQPVEFNPDKNIFKVAQFPGDRPNLDFILTNESVPANHQLVRYLYDVLYKTNQLNNKGGYHE